MPGAIIMKKTTIFLETQFIALKINRQTLVIIPKYS
jgi:hypothetical protein